MKANVTLKESFLKRRISGDNEISAQVELSNGKKLNLYFILGKRTIEVTHKKDQCEKKKLTEEERIARIEEILVKYTSLINSILHVTISYCIEQYRLADSTNISKDMDLEEIVSKETIFEEYVNSAYSRNSVNIVLRSIKSIYDFISKNKSKIGKEDVIIKIEYKLNYIQKSDLKYYINTLLQCIGITDVTLTIPKGENYLLIEPIKN